jgi:hypothetical protein
LPKGLGDVTDLAEGSAKPALPKGRLNGNCFNYLPQLLYHRSAVCFGAFSPLLVLSRSISNEIDEECEQHEEL